MPQRKNDSSPWEKEALEFENECVHSQFTAFLYVHNEIFEYMLTYFATDRSGLLLPYAFLNIC